MRLRSVIPAQSERNAVNLFISKHGRDVTGVLSGFDRMLFFATIRAISFAGGMAALLKRMGVALQGFGEFVEDCTERLLRSTLALPISRGRPSLFLRGNDVRKNEYAEEIAHRDKIRDGLICTFRTVEPCKTFRVRKHGKNSLKVTYERTKCIHVYHYFMDPVFGFMHARLQSWFPFSIQICINGREWLSRQMDGAGLTYTKRENCFLQIEDWKRAQDLATEQLRTPWTQQLSRIVRVVASAVPGILGVRGCDYYYTLRQSEWATDVLFKDTAVLDRLMPSLTRHSILSLGCDNVMRFLGTSKPNGNLRRSVKSYLRSERREGLRVKHWFGHNSIKLYQKHGTVLRAETTINQAGEFTVLRPKDGDPKGECRRRVMRQGIADLYRRSQVSDRANKNYLDAISAADTSAALGDVFQRVITPVEQGGKRSRGLRPWSPDDLKLFKFIMDGKFHLRGFRNFDLRKVLFPIPTHDPVERRKRSARASRLLRLLRAHGLIKKLPLSRSYRVTKGGRETLATILVAQGLTLDAMKASA